MMRLVLISTGALAAGFFAAAPAVVGLAGNPSFSHQIPVRIPAHARPVQLVDDHGSGARRTPTQITAPSASHVPSRVRQVEPGDDRTTATRHREPAEDRDRRGRGGPDDGHTDDAKTGRGRDGRGDGDSGHRTRDK